MRLRAGDSVREIARSGLMGRGKLDAVAKKHGWLDAGIELPDDVTVVAAAGEGNG